MRAFWFYLGIVSEALLAFGLVYYLALLNALSAESGVCLTIGGQTVCKSSGIPYTSLVLGFTSLVGALIGVATMLLFAWRGIGKAGGAIIVGELLVLGGILVSRLEAPTCYLGCPIAYSVYALPIGLIGFAIVLLGITSILMSKRKAAIASILVSGIVLTIFFAPVVYDYPVQRAGCAPHGPSCPMLLQSITLEYLQIGGMLLPGDQYCVAALQRGTSWSGFGCIIGG